jgi:phosphonate transport system substrate-binding protein
MRQAKRFGLWRFLVAIIACWPMLACAQKADTVEFGILPILSTLTLLTVYEPLRAYLQERLQKPVAFVTAPSYRAFIERTRRSEFRYIITAPHFARLAQKEDGYQPLVRVKSELIAILVADKGAGITQIDALRGKTVTTPDSLAIISFMAREYLRQQGLVPDRDVFLKSEVSFNSAVIAVRNGASAAAATSPTALKQMPPEIRESLLTLGTTNPVQGITYLASHKVPAKEMAGMQQLLLEFSATAAGKEFFKNTGFVDFVRTSDDEMRALDVYVVELKKQLAIQ